MSTAILMTFAFLTIGFLVLLTFVIVSAIRRLDFDDSKGIPSPEPERRRQKS